MILRTVARENFSAPAWHSIFLLILTALFNGAYTEVAAQVLQPAVNLTAGNTNIVRGRVQVVNNSVVADNGQPLRFVHSHIGDWGYNGYLNSPDWWKQMRDVGHFNGVRVMAFVGSDYKPWGTMDQGTLLSRLDTALANASAAGMYLLIDNHSDCCGQENMTTAQTFWKLVAPRYANNTNVLYELQNEPSQYDVDGTPAINGVSPYYPYFENTLYQLVRGYAPNTHIIGWTIENLLDQDLGTQLQFLAQGTAFDYSNSSVGFHPYDTTNRGGVSALEERILAIKAKYPVICSEFAQDTAYSPADQSILPWMDAHGVSWGWLDSTGFEPVGGPCYGPGGCSKPLQIYWSLDPGTLATAPTNPVQPLADGIYTLANLQSKLVLDDPGWSTVSGTQLIQWAANSGNNQKWQFTANGSGQYVIVNLHSGLYLTDANNGKLQQVLQANNDSQLWLLNSQGSGVYTLVNKATGRAIDDPGMSMASGVGIITWSVNGGANQNWQIK